MVFEKIKNIKNSIFGRISESVGTENNSVVNTSEEKDYIELDSKSHKENNGKLFVKYFVLNDYADVKPVIDSLRESQTIALVKIKPLREKDMTELKRAVNKINSTVEVANGELVGIDHDWVIAVPPFVEVFRGETLPDSGKEEI